MEHVTTFVAAHSRTILLGIGAFAAVSFLRLYVNVLGARRIF